MPNPTIGLFTVASGMRHLEPRIRNVRRCTLNPEAVQIDFEDSFVIVTPGDGQAVEVLYTYRKHPKADWSQKRALTTVGALPELVANLVDARFLRVVA